MSTKLIWIILLIAITVDLTAQVYYFSSGQNLLFGDARSHLNIARRVYDSTNPGLAQLGGVWLPLLHVLMLPFVRYEMLWHTGLAGAIVNFFSFIIAVIFIFKIGEILFESKLIQFLIPLFYILNPNIIYMSTTAMTEVLFIATFTGAIFFLLKWSKTDKLLDLIIGAIFIYLTSINRYEGWSIVMASFFTVFLILLAKKVKKETLEGSLILFSCLAFLGIFLWLIWNQTIFGDPLYFLHSIYSSKLQTEAGFKIAGNQTVLLYKNLPLSLLGYLFAVIANTGIVITLSGIIGLITCCGIILFGKRDSKDYKFYLSILLLLAPYLFESYAIYKGNVPLHIPEITGGIFNIRLGMYVIPSVCVFIMLFLRKIPSNFFRLSILAFIISAQFTLFYPSIALPVTLQSASEGIGPKIEAAKWMSRNYHGGKILASSAAGDPLLFDSGLKLNEFIDDGSSKLFINALKYPQKYTKYIVMTKQPVDMQRDLVYIHLSKTDKWKKYYKVAFDNLVFKIYALKNDQILSYKKM